MLTRTLFSAISYNSDAFLMRKLDELVDDRVLSFWCFINHKAEADELKDHKHVLMMPCGQQETVSICRELEEYVEGDLPLKTLGVKHSQFADWYMYALHDRDYLLSKGKEKKYHYLRDDFICSDYDLFSEYINTSDFTKWKKIAEFRDAVRHGVPFVSLVQNGIVPIQQIYQYQKAYDMLCGWNLTSDERVSEFDLVDDEDFSCIEDGGC